MIKMELLDIGKELQAARELKGLTIEQVYEETRIGIEFLKSLEQGKTDKMPHPVYARGFVRSYASYLGLDSQRIVEDFSRIYRDEDHFENFNPDDLPTSLRTSGIKTVTFTRGTTACLVAFSIVLVVAAVLGLGWYLYTSQFSTKPEDDPARLAPVTPAADAPVQHYPEEVDKYLEMDPFAGEDGQEVQPQPEIDSDPASTADSDEPSSLQEYPGPVEDVEVPNESTLISPDSNEQEEEAEVVSVSEPATRSYNEDAAEDIAEEKSRLVIQARENCWMMIMVDDSSREVYLRSGESVRLEFEYVARITLGNAGGVDIIFNGQPYPFEASSGQVKTLQFSSSDSPS